MGERNKIRKRDTHSLKEFILVCKSKKGKSFKLFPIVSVIKVH